MIPFTRIAESILSQALVHEAIGGVMLHGKKVVIGSILLLLMAAVAVVLIVWFAGDFPQASVRSPKRI